jgi:hypothetical protein
MYRVKEGKGRGADLGYNSWKDKMMKITSEMISMAKTFIIIPRELKQNHPLLKGN